VSHGNIYGLAVDATNKFAITSGHDKRINIWSIANGRNMRAYKVQGATDDVYKTDTDPASTVLAVCSLDKHVRLIDFFSGELIEDVVGHSESVTAVRFSPDGEYLVSVGGDGCIFVWKVAEELLQVRGLRVMLQSDREVATFVWNSKCEAA
jgi:WD40 repeat protein